MNWPSVPHPPAGSLRVERYNHDRPVEKHRLKLGNCEPGGETVIREQGSDPRRHPLPPVHRRRFLAATGTVWLGLAGVASAGQDPNGEGAKVEKGELAEIEAKARQAGLRPFRHVQSAHFLALGDSAAEFQREALSICEEMGKAFLVHFRRLGFTVDYPSHRLSVIALKDDASYAAWLGGAAGEDEGGHYDLESNRLVIFDLRAAPAQQGQAAQARRANLFALVHETGHLLCFNTGVLVRPTRLPLCISEGLATYVEMWRPGVRNAMGGENRPRMQALREAEDWISIADLLADDAAFDAKTQQLAYAESWLLVHYLLRSRLRQPRLRDYLAQAQAAKDAAGRAGAAEKALGPLRKLDAEVKDDAKRYLRG